MYFKYKEKGVCHRHTLFFCYYMVNMLVQKLFCRILVMLIFRSNCKKVDIFSNCNNCHIEK